jgi:hypothetical protein
MAVPSSGTLSMLGLAREKVHDNYSSTSTPTAPYSIYDLVNGGNTNGSGVSFDATNTNSSSYPNTSTPHQMSEWFSYDHDATSSSHPILVYQSSLTASDPIYTYNSSGIWDDGGEGDILGLANYTTEDGRNCSNEIILDTGAKSNQSDHYIYFDIQNVNGDTYYNSAFTVYFKWEIANYQYLNVEIGTYERSSQGAISYTNSSSILSAGGSSGTSSTGSSSLSVPALGTGEDREGIYFKASRGYGNWSGDIIIYDINTSSQC